jgi:hypothetical protein
LEFPSRLELVTDWNSTITIAVDRMTERERAFKQITPLHFTSNSYFALNGVEKTGYFNFQIEKPPFSELPNLGIYTYFEAPL